MIPDEHPDNLEDLLDRFAAGECTAAEAGVVTRWIDADPAPPARRQRLERFRRLWAATRRPAVVDAESWDVDRAWRRAAARLASAKGLTLVPRAPAHRRAAFSRPVVRWAAAAVLVVGSAAIWATVSTRGRGARINNGVAAAGAVREYVAARGERKVLTLADGTRVMLAPGSRLAVPLDYGRGTSRQVRIDGEGSFDVFHDAARPFAVRAGQALVRDIGTKFVVRAYGAGQPVVVAVTEGEVLLADARLRQGDLGRLDATGALQVRRAADLRSYTSWTDGPLIFDDMPLAEAIPVLERWYDLDITVADRSLYSRRLFATLGNVSVAQLLDVLALSLELRVERHGRAVTLSR